MLELLLECIGESEARLGDLVQAAENLAYVRAQAERQYIYLRGYRANSATVIGGTSTTSGAYTLIVTTTGNSVVTVLYGHGAGGGISENLNLAATVCLSLIPLLIIATAVSDAQADALGTGTLWKIVIMVAIFGVMAWMFAGWGY